MLASTGSSDTSRSTMMAASEDSKSSSMQLLASSPERSGQNKHVSGGKRLGDGRQRHHLADVPSERGGGGRPEAAQSQRSAVIYRKGFGHVRRLPLSSNRQGMCRSRHIMLSCHFPARLRCCETWAQVNVHGRE